MTVTSKPTRCESSLGTSVRSRLVQTHIVWHFQQRDGDVGEQLTSAAEALRTRHGVGASIVIAVGASAHGRDDEIGRTATQLRRDARFPVFVVL